MIAKAIVFTGKVQGVGFRYTCREQAKGYDVTGEVENMPDGTVRMLLIGEAEEVEEYLRELTEDSSMAHHIKLFEVYDLTEVPSVAGFRIVR